MRSIDQEQVLISELSKNCLNKLRVNCHKYHWYDVTFSNLLIFLKQEVTELEQAVIDDLDEEEVWKEAADVANFAAMVADKYKQQRKAILKEK